MAEKRYYWLKLKEDYFTNPKIKKLRKIAGGDTFTIIYLKMQLLSISNSGVIEFEGIEPTFEEELALKLDEDLENVQLTLAYLKTQCLIETNNNEYLLVDACKNIGSECDSAKRVRDFREKQKVLQCNEDVTPMLQNSISISNSISKSKKNKEDYEDIINDKVKNENVKSTIYEFIKMRKLIKKPMTNRALELMINKLHKLATTPDDAMAILEQSIMNNWQDIYELKEKKQKTNYVEGYNGEYADLV